MLPCLTQWSFYFIHSKSALTLRDYQDNSVSSWHLSCSTIISTTLVIEKWWQERELERHTGLLIALVLRRHTPHNTHNPLVRLMTTNNIIIDHDFHDLDACLEGEGNQILVITSNVYHRNTFITSTLKSEYGVWAKYVEDLRVHYLSHLRKRTYSPKFPSMRL